MTQVAELQLNSYRDLAPTAAIARKRLKRVRSDWLQWLLFDSLCDPLPRWSISLLCGFTRNYSDFANHSRKRLDSATEPRAIVEGLLWRRDAPGLLGYVDPVLLTNAASEAEIDLQRAWEREQCGPLTANYLMAHCKPVLLTDDLPDDLKRWW